MSNSRAIPLIEASDSLSPSRAIHSRWHWLAVLRSPLWVCIALAVIVRVWLTVHTQGVVSGDEAIAGIQAEHILRGEHPIYYYGQPYMGSLAAYFIAFIFLITGPSVWALRIEPTLIALVLVYLTWRFSAALADAAHLSGRAKTLFMIIATLVAAFPPLYDVIEEVGANSGYVEAFTIMLWLLYCAFRLIQRWRANASSRELALRWAGIGFLVGLGFWINPLIVYAYVAIALWIGYYVISELVRPRRQNVTRLAMLKETLLFITAIPAMLIGFAPGLYWGAQNQWQNISYVFQNGGTVSHGRLHTILKMQQLYITCLAPRAIGGALSTNPGVTVANPHILTFGLVVGTCCLAISALSVGLSVLWPHRLLVQIRQLTLLPLLFFFCASIIFSTASIAATALIAGCGPWNIVGRYVVPLVIALPFFIAAAITIPAIIFQERLAGSAREKDDREPVSQLPARSVSTRSPVLAAIQVGLLAVLAIYFCVQAFAYMEADPRYTFQASGCASVNPTNLDPIISYMQQAHIRFAWGTDWIATPITFRTNSAILITGPHARIAADILAVLNSDRPSILLLARHDDSHSAFLRALDARNVIYHAERFYSVPGVDELVVTPLNRTVSPLDPAFADAFHIGGFHSLFSGCL